MGGAPIAASFAHDLLNVQVYIGIGPNIAQNTTTCIITPHMIYLLYRLL